MLKIFDSIPAQTWSKIAKIDELKGKWIAGVRLSPQVLGKLKRSALVTSSGASTRIEGSHLSDEDVEQVMKGIAVERFADRDKQEVKGYYELLENVFNSWDTVRFNESTIKHFHQELLKYVEKDKLHRGEYKKTENKVQMVDAQGRAMGIIFDTTSPHLTPNKMLELCEKTRAAFENSNYHSLLIISYFVVEFLRIHPFKDGNGRLSRVLTNLLLLQHGYQFVAYVSHEKLIEEEKSEYYIALRRTQKTFIANNVPNIDVPNIVPWLNFFLSIVLKQAEIAEQLLSGKNIENLLSAKQLIVWKYLHTVDEATPKEIQENTGVQRPTINQIVNKLVKMKKIERIGQGRATRYRITP